MTLMHQTFFIISLLLFITKFTLSNEITPYKYTDTDRKNGLKPYNIPESSRFKIKQFNTTDITYYFSRPKANTFPIAILCGGSSSDNDIISIIHFHRYFLKEFLNLNIAVLTVEQQGVDGNNINSKEFMQQYTRSKRLQDHNTVINHLRKNPPENWNGQLIFLGVSEGGPLVTSLTTQYQDITRATINWSGTGDWSWREELWLFIKNIKKQLPWFIKLRTLIPKTLPFSLALPKKRQEYDAIMDQTLKTPDHTKTFMGMTYKYHADALTYPAPDYHKIRTPFLVVTGAKDTIIDSSDAFVQKAKDAGAPVTYLRVPDMDHYIRTRPEIIEQSFEWLKQQLH